VVAYLTLGLSLFPDDDYEEVAAKVTGRVVGADRQRDHPGPGRLGRGVFPELFERPCGPVAGDAGPHAALTALGTARDSVPAGLAAAGHRRVRAGPAGHPGQRGRVRVRRVRGQPGANRSALCKARVVALAECGTHAFLAAEVDGYQSSLGIDRTADSNHAWPPPGDWKACSATGPRGKSAILGHRVG